MNSPELQRARRGGSGYPLIYAEVEITEARTGTGRPLGYLVPTGRTFYYLRVPRWVYRAVEWCAVWASELGLVHS